MNPFASVLIDLDPHGYKSGRWKDKRIEDYMPDLDHNESRFYPFFYLIADNIVEANATTPSSLPFVKKAFGKHEGRPHIYDYAKNDEGILFTPERLFKADVMQSQGLTARTATFILAAAGLEITIPNLTINVARSEEVVRVRELLTEERERYLASMIRIADESFDRLANHTYKDTAAWALNEAEFKIRPKAIEYENAIKKLDRNLLKRIQLNFFCEGVPAIGSATLEKGLKEGAIKAVSVGLEVLCKNLSKSIEERKSPEVVYGVKFKHSLQKDEA